MAGEGTSGACMPTPTRDELAAIIYPFLISDPADGHHEHWPRPKPLPSFAVAQRVADAVLAAEHPKP